MTRPFRFRMRLPRFPTRNCGIMEGHEKDMQQSSRAVLFQTHTCSLQPPFSVRSRVKDVTLERETIRTSKSRNAGCMPECPTVADQELTEHHFPDTRGLAWHFSRNERSWREHGSGNTTKLCTDRNWKRSDFGALHNPQAWIEQPGTMFHAKDGRPITALEGTFCVFESQKDCALLL
jgi:hypothetical protein